eukprot:CAMPEP_0172644906 /NCGR_PEP_ID=MMETSP1068-20121228/239455_1 /TAXON_ID=35684 /ORGANISM="Pseudopedinella elastica, Strain CCMP716" /LENGTH=466 /DNA_ID=CAMNT_0013459125 /DNA_START=120 /DNA_END=1521 /DNA_ORIENTATION=-
MATTAAVVAGVHNRQHNESADSANQPPPTPPKKKKEAEEPPEYGEGIWYYQPKTLIFYRRLDVQLAVAFLIAANFVTNIVQMQQWPTGVCARHEIDPEWQGEPCADYEENDQGCTYFGDCHNQRVYFAFELVYNVAFTLELLINMYGAWFFAFWMDPWNVFDFIVVTVGVFGVAKVDLGSLSMLRMLRAFRVFRLRRRVRGRKGGPGLAEHAPDVEGLPRVPALKRVKSLNKIIVSLGKAAPGVANSFLILLLVMCIYSILATELFRDVGLHGKFVFFPLPDAARTHKVVDKEYFTARSGEFGREYFGTFGRSLYTMFQVLTGESWSEAVARPLIDGTEYPFSVAIYFVTFNLICGVVLINVVVAVLLEKMVEEDEPEEEEEEQEELGPDDPLREITQLIKRLESSQAAQQSQQKNMQTDMAAVCAAMSNLSSAVNSVFRTLPRPDTHPPLPGTSRMLTSPPPPNQ